VSNLNQLKDILITKDIQKEKSKLEYYLNRPASSKTNNEIRVDKTKSVFTFSDSFNKNDFKLSIIGRRLAQSELAFH